MNYDIIVIGAGPAGSTFCRYISSQYKVLLIDKRAVDFDHNFTSSKACGGLLNLECQRELAVQSLAIPKEVLHEPQMFTVRAFDFDHSISRYYQKSYMNVDRTLFDSFLFNRIGSHVEVLTSALYLSHRVEDHSVEVKIKRNGAFENYTCKRLIDATGATCALRRSLKKKIRNYACIQRHYKYKDRLPYMFSVFDKNVTDYYSWGIQKADTLIVGSAIDDTKRAKEKFDILITKLSEIGFDLSSEIKREGALLLRPRKTSDVFVGEKPVHAIGEAASLISPSSSEGISFALRSGRFLAEAFNRSYVNYLYDYHRALKSLKMAMFIKEKKSRLMYPRLSRGLIIKSGVLSTKVKDEINFIP